MMTLKFWDNCGSYTCNEDRGWGRTQKRWSVTKQEAEILRDMALGRKVLEIGTGLGVATRAMAEKAISVDTVDMDPWVRENVDLPDNCRVFESIPTDGDYDLVFIDGDHSYEAVTNDFLSVLPLTTSDAVIVFHDYTHHAHKGVHRAVHDLGLESYVEVIKSYNGMAVWRRGRE